jgi:Co/Zn/Cd efflux system component
MRKTSTRLRKLAQPQTASQAGLGVHLALAALKLPAALLSGSVGLLNDATDTLLDGISSVLVYLGLRWERERAANIVLVLLMLVTGGLTFYEAARRFLVPSAPEADWFTFSATILSALVCLALGLYQRFVGLRSGSLALITQSVDSRNHVITAASVTAGLVASLLSFPLLDTLVGLAVAGLILKSAIELTIELVRTLGDDDVDLGHYQMGIAEWYEQFRQTQLRDWMLYVVEKQNVHTRRELIAQGQQVIDVSGNPALRELGVQQQPGVESLVETCLSELLKREWLLENGQLRLADAAREHLNRQMKAKEHSKALILTRRKNVSQRNEIYFKMMSFIHETLYGVFRDPYQVLYSRDTLWRVPRSISSPDSCRAQAKPARPGGRLRSRLFHRPGGRDRWRAGKRPVS